MKVIYIADDGKEFDNEFDCQHYEWILNHPYLKDICFYDKDNNALDNILLQETYETTERIVISNKDALNDLLELANYTGFCAYGDIVECGEWVFDYKKGTFVKV